MTGTNLISGLDTDNIIKALVANTQSKIDRQEQMKQIAEWRQELYRGVIDDIKAFSNTYFSYINSETNLLSSTFFRTTDLISSSDAVKASGNVDNAQNLVINSIAQLAGQAAYSSSHKVSDQAITSGELLPSWTQSNVGGKSLVVSYNGTDYTLTMSYGVKLDSENLSTDEGIRTELRKIVGGLNDQIAANGSLKGKVEFKLTEDADGKPNLTLSPTDPEAGATVGVKADPSDTDPAGSQAFLKALGFSGAASGSGVAGTALDANVATSGLFNKTVSSSSSLVLSVGGETYTIKLGADVTIRGSSDPDKAAAKKDIAEQLQKEINAKDGYKDKISISYDEESGTIQLKSLEGKGIAVTGGSENLLEGLGLEGTSAAGDSPITVSELDTGALVRSYLGDTLAGSTLTFTLDGIAKSVTFDASRQADYSSSDKIASYLKEKLASLFGGGRIDVTGEDGKLRFETADPTSVLSVTADDSSNVLNRYGALRIRYGETNRAETDKTLDELAGEFGLEKETDGIYRLSVNGSDFEFTEDTTLADVISRINGDPDAGVTISYSQTADTFRIVADDSGSQGSIAFSDRKGNLAAALFGMSYASADLTGQDGSVTIAEDAAYSFTLDGKRESVTVAAGTYGSLDELRAAVQSRLETAFGAGGIEVSADAENGKLLFRAGGDHSILAVSPPSGGNPLGLSAAVDPAEYSAGKDLIMSVSLNGSDKPTPIVRSSNTVTLDGVNLQVKDTTETAVTFSSESSVDDLSQKIVDFINAYNKIIDKVNSLTSQTPNQERKYTPLTDDQKKDMSDDEIEKWETEAKKGLLQNDSVLNGILSDLHAAMTGAVESAGLSLSDLGITTQPYDYTSGGQLAVDTAKLKQQLTSDSEAVMELFTGSDGISARVKSVLDRNVGTFGGDGALLLRAGSSTDANDTSLLATQIKAYDQTISKLKEQLQTEEDRYWSKFTQMEQALSAMDAQMSYLSSMLGNSDNS